MMEFTKALWMQDAASSLRNLLQHEAAQTQFLAFLRAEYGEAQLEFFLEAEKLEAMDMEEQMHHAREVYKQFLMTGGDGVGAQDRTSATQAMWDFVNGQGTEEADYMDGQEALQRIKQEAEQTLNMLSFDAFPRFLKSKYINSVMSSLKSSGQGGAEQAALEAALVKSGSQLPQDADEWLNMFVTAAETFPACIVISDMTIPGAPMIFVNNEFCRTTGYSKEDAQGRNCRFLQGPLTEPESVAVIRNTLAKGQECHVKLTNYRKNGELFQNLLSMKPVFDMEGIYRYVIGVQFEIIEDDNLRQRLVSLDKLLKMLPSRLNLKSKAAARAKGYLAAKVGGEVNQMVAQGKQDAILREGNQVDQAERKKKVKQPKANVNDAPNVSTASLDFTNTVFALTRLHWLQNPEESLRSLLQDPRCAPVVIEFADGVSEVARTYMRFALDVEKLNMCPDSSRGDLCRRMLIRKVRNELFYFSMVEITYGMINVTDMGPIYEELRQKQEVTLSTIGREVLTRLLNSSIGYALIKKIRSREIDGDSTLVPATIASGLDSDGDSFFLDMFKAVCDGMNVGVSISDMQIPGIPLTYVNNGFCELFGWSQEECIGRNCRFVQGDETQDYLVREISDALQHAEPLCTKLYNYKKSGQRFQCMFCLQPIHFPDGTYKYMFGVHADFQPTQEITQALVEMEMVLRNIPRSLTGERSDDKARLIPTSPTGDETLHPKCREIKAGEMINEGDATPETAPIAEATPVQNAQVLTKMAPSIQAPKGGIQVTTGAGKGKYHNGKKFAKKQQSAMMDFTKALWMSDAQNSLSKVLRTKEGAKQMGEFLKKEYAEEQLLFWLEADKMRAMKPGKSQSTKAIKIYKDFVKVGGDGFGKQERTEATANLWATHASEGGTSDKSEEAAVDAVIQEANKVLQMMAFDSFPRFLKSEHSSKALNALKKGGKKTEGEASGLQQALESAGSQLPQDADEWLNSFVTFAETFPSCIVISDMTIPGAPMIYVNSEFCQTTGYTKEDAQGRNCRFLQGPLTEPESVAVIRNTLAKGEECHVKLTNYRKNGELFQNLLSMKPVFDLDGIYRYVIGVQFEIIEDENLRQRLVSLDKLLKMLPSRLNLKSKAAARAKGRLASRVDGDANTEITSKDKVLKQVQSEGMQESRNSSGQPRMVYKGQAIAGMGSVNYDRTIFAYTKMAWLNHPVDAMRAIMADELCSQYVQAFSEKHMSILANTHVQFLMEAQMLDAAAPAAKANLARRLFMRRWRNPLFYTTMIEIDYGTLMQQNWGPHLAEVEKWSENSVLFLAQELFPKFMDNALALEMMDAVRQRESRGGRGPCQTVAAGLGSGESYYIDLFKVMSESSSLPMVITDMCIPGLPLNYVNESFANTFGYSKQDAIGKNCKFLQGPATPYYLVEEIMEALQHGEDLCIKLENYKKSGELFHNCFALHSVYNEGRDQEYKYSVAVQCDFSAIHENSDMAMQLIEMERFSRCIPQMVGGTAPKEITATLNKLKKVGSTGVATNDVDAAKGGNGGGGGGMFGGSKKGFGGSPRRSSAAAPKVSSGLFEDKGKPTGGWGDGGIVPGMSGGDNSGSSVGSGSKPNGSSMFGGGSPRPPARSAPASRPAASPRPSIVKPVEPRKSFSPEPATPPAPRPAPVPAPAPAPKMSMTSPAAPTGGMFPQIGSPTQQQNGNGMNGNGTNGNGMQQPIVSPPMQANPQAMAMFGGGGGASQPIGGGMYQQTIEQLSAPIAWVVLPGGIRCPVIPASL